MIFSSCALFHNLPQLHHVTPSHPSLGDKPPECKRVVRKRTGQSKNGRVNSIKPIWTRALHSILSSAHCLAACTSSFLTQSIHDTQTKHLKHFILRTFTSLLSALFTPHASAPYNVVGTITPLYRHCFTFIPILYCSAHHYFAQHIHFTWQFHDMTASMT